MSRETSYDEFDSDDFDSNKFEKVKPPQRFVTPDKDRRDNWREKRRSKEKDRNKFFER